MKTCFMVGHRDFNENIYPALEATVEKCIRENGIREFVVGHYGRFDGMAAQVIRAAKARHPEIRLILLLPYLTEHPLPEGFDGSIYPEGLETVPKRYAILRANCKIIEQSDCVIAYVRHTFGGAFQCVEYARRKKKPVLRVNYE